MTKELTLEEVLKNPNCLMLVNSREFYDLLCSVPGQAKTTPGRVTTCLQGARYMFVAEVMQDSLEDLYKIRGFGWWAGDLLQKALANLGLELGTVIPNRPVDNQDFLSLLVNAKKEEHLQGSIKAGRTSPLIEDLNQLVKEASRDILDVTLPVSLNIGGTSPIPKKPNDLETKVQLQLGAEVAHLYKSAGEVLGVGTMPVRVMEMMTDALRLARNVDKLTHS